MGRVDMNPDFRREYVAEVGPEWQREAGEFGETSITASMPILTGNMRLLTTREDFTDDEGRPSIRFIGRAEYTEWVDQGTGFHGPFKTWIEPQVAKALSWIDANSGQRVHARRTRGQRGQHFFYRGLTAIFARVVEYPYGRR